MPIRQIFPVLTTLTALVGVQYAPAASLVAAHTKAQAERNVLRVVPPNRSRKQAANCVLEKRAEAKSASRARSVAACGSEGTDPPQTSADSGVRAKDGRASLQPAGENAVVTSCSFEGVTRERCG